VHHLGEQVRHLVNEGTYQFNILPQICLLLIKKHVLGVLDLGQPQVDGQLHKYRLAGLLDQDVIVFVVRLVHSIMNLRIGRLDLLMITRALIMLFSELPHL